MKNFLFFTITLAFLFMACNKRSENVKIINKNYSNYTLSFGSCNNQNLPNKMWSEILKNEPDIFIWGGDIVYSDTHDMELMKINYNKQKQDSSYQYFIEKIPVMGTWDDHDYGLNDGGSEYEKKDSVQQIFLDFFDVDSTDKRRSQQGVYYSDKINIGENSISVIVLDTRYFRSKLTKDPTGIKRYIPSENGNMLGDDQWNWLKNELENSNANFNIIVSSIQFLSYEHGFESWGTMPNEVLKLKKIISESKAKGVIILSGDRHLAEISKDSIPGMAYPLIDFTSSGLTHSYTSYTNEENKYRVSKIISDKNFGLLHFNFKKNKVKMEIRGEKNSLLESYSQKF